MIQMPILNLKPALLLAVLLSGASPLQAQTQADVRRFLTEQTHAWLPYPLPYETNTTEIEWLLSFETDTVGICFAGRLIDGTIDTATLDQALVQVEKAGKKAVLHLLPRFGDDEGIADTLSNGKALKHNALSSPDYSILDIFDPAQRKKYDQWLKIIGEKLGSDARVAAFTIGWGYMGETGFYIGDFLADGAQFGAVSAGYSQHALKEYNNWRRSQKLSALEILPLPSTNEQSVDYVQFLRFRSEFIRDTFQKAAVAELKKHTSKPVGIFGYVATGPESYARNWSPTPNADFYRTAGIAGSFDIEKTLVDSGIGFEDSNLHDGGFHKTLSGMKRDFARQISRGAAHHIMLYRDYATEPGWEPDILSNIAQFLRTTDLRKKLKREKPDVAVFNATWSIASLPARSPEQPFLSRADYALYMNKMTGLAESFGLNYRIVTEQDLLNLASLKSYRYIIIHNWDNMKNLLDEKTYKTLDSDSRTVKIPLKDRPLTRSEYRDILRKAGVDVALDFESEKILAGRTGNLVYNWSNAPLAVQVPEIHPAVHLEANEYRILDKD